MLLKYEDLPKNQNVIGGLVSELLVFISDTLICFSLRQYLKLTRLLTCLSRPLVSQFQALCNMNVVPPCLVPGVWWSRMRLFGSASCGCSPCHSLTCQTCTRQLSGEMCSHPLHRLLCLSELKEQYCISKGKWAFLFL